MKQGTKTAEAARVELAARAAKLRASGWTDEPPDRPSWLVYKTCATDEQRAAHRRAVIARARKLVARLDAQQRERLVYKIYAPPPTEPVPPVPPVKPTKGGYDRFMEKQDAELRERLQLSEADIQHRQRLSRDARALWDARRVNKLEQAMSDTPSTISRMDVATTEAWRAWFTEGFDLHLQNAFQNFICPEIRRAQVTLRHCGDKHSARARGRINFGDSTLLVSEAGSALPSAATAGLLATLSSPSFSLGRLGFLPPEAPARRRPSFSFKSQVRSSPIKIGLRSRLLCSLRDARAVGRLGEHVRNRSAAPNKR